MPPVVKNKPRRLTPEQQELVLSCLSLAHHVAIRWKRTYRNDPEFCDVAESEALFGLCYAATRFDPSRGWKFTTFASVVLRNWMVNIRRQIHKHPIPCQLPKINVHSRDGREYDVPDPRLEEFQRETDMQDLWEEVSLRVRASEWGTVQDYLYPPEDTNAAKNRVRTRMRLIFPRLRKRMSSDNWEDK